MLKQSLYYFAILATLGTGVYADEIKKTDETSDEIKNKSEQVLVQVKEEDEEEAVEEKKLLAGCPTGKCPTAGQEDDEEEEENTADQAKLA